MMWFIKCGGRTANVRIVAVSSQEEVWKYLQVYKDEYGSVPECLCVYEAVRILDWS